MGARSFCFHQYNTVLQPAIHHRIELLTSIVCCYARPVFISINRNNGNLHLFVRYIRSDVSAKMNIFTVEANSLINKSISSVNKTKILNLSLYYKRYTLLCKESERTKKKAQNKELRGEK